MARGRVIDRKIHTDEDLATVQIQARYLYKALIIHADDEGRMKANPIFLKALIFPFDEAIRVDTVKQWRDELVSIGVIKLYAAGGKEYLSHPNWERWQPLRKDRLKPSDCPDDNQVATSCQPNGNQWLPIPNLTQPNQTGKVLAFAKPSLEEITAYCAERRNGINAQQFFDHYEANGWVRGKTKIRDWRACVRTWEQKRNQERHDERPTEVVG